MTDPLAPPDESPPDGSPPQESTPDESPLEESPPAIPPPAIPPPAIPPAVDVTPPDEEVRAPRPLLVAALLAAGVALGVSVTLVVVVRRAPSTPQRALVAELAAQELHASVAWVAMACGVEPGEAANPRETLRLSFERCGPDPFRPGPAPPDALLLPPRPARAAEPVALPRKSAPERPDPCLERCAGAHSACGKACGPEPVGDAFVAWQACGTRCLTESSRCRLGCP